MSDSQSMLHKHKGCEVEAGISELAQISECDLCLIMGIAERYPGLAGITSVELDGDHAAYLRCNGQTNVKYYIPGLSQAEVQHAIAMLVEAKIIAGPTIVRLPR